MTDRELLEAAAKAAGIPLKADFAERYYYYMADPLMWNPLTDDGDALRLAVKLRLHTTWGKCNVWAKPTGTGDTHEPFDADPYAAIRRAIVRAAAGIGRDVTNGKGWGEE